MLSCINYLIKKDTRNKYMYNCQHDVREKKENAKDTNHTSLIINEKQHISFIKFIEFEMFGRDIYIRNQKDKGKRQCRNDSATTVPLTNDNIPIPTSQCEQIESVKCELDKYYVDVEDDVDKLIIENMENMENMENLENMENMENMENIEYMENMENIDNKKENETIDSVFEDDLPMIASIASSPVCIEQIIPDDLMDSEIGLLDSIGIIDNSSHSSLSYDNHSSISGTDIITDTDITDTNNTNIGPVCHHVSAGSAISAISATTNPVREKKRKCRNTFKRKRSPSAHTDTSQTILNHLYRYIPKNKYPVNSLLRAFSKSRLEEDVTELKSAYKIDKIYANWRNTESKKRRFLRIQKRKKKRKLLYDDEDVDEEEEDDDDEYFHNLY